MATIFKYAVGLYKEYIVNRADPRVENLLFFSSIQWPLAITFAYLYFVNKLGPQLMKNRKPFELKNFMVAYNIFQIAINLYLLKEAFMTAYVKLKYSLICAHADYSEDPDVIWLTRLSWGFFMVKLLDLVDTIVMILRKKQNQVSFLHIYHHAGMIFVTWVGAKYLGGGHSVLIGVINCFVHSVMYAYYLLTAIYPEYKTSAWWKRHLTELQMVQFIYMTFHSALVVFNPYCNFSRTMMLVFMIQNGFMFAMFLDFYVRTYFKNNKDTMQHELKDNKKN